jgi:hypothetical protein
MKVLDYLITGHPFTTWRPTLASIVGPQLCKSRNAGRKAKVGMKV